MSSTCPYSFFFPRQLTPFPRRSTGPLVASRLRRSLARCDKLHTFGVSCALPHAPYAQICDVWNMVVSLLAVLPNNGHLHRITLKLGRYLPTRPPNWEQAALNWDQLIHTLHSLHSLRGITFHSMLLEHVDLTAAQQKHVLSKMTQDQTYLPEFINFDNTLAGLCDCDG